MWHVIILPLLFSCLQIACTFGLNDFQDVRIKRQGIENNCTTTEGDIGMCVPITECTELVDLLVQNKYNETVTRLIKKAHCGFTDKTPKVCCKNNESDVYDHLPRECGNPQVSIDRRVAGRAPLNAWPWIVLIGSEYNATTYRWKCLGALVTNSHVVTSAYCISSFGKPTHVRLGELDIESDTDGAKHMQREIERLMPHPRFNMINKVNDIGIVMLRNPVTFSAGIKPICLPVSPKLRARDFTGSKSYIAGWGRTDLINVERPSHQREATISVRSRDECYAAYSNFTQFVTIDEHVVCVGGGKNEACQGDGGGPLMVESDGLLYMLGTVSYGSRCGEMGYPEVYTNVPYYVDWIVENTRDDNIY